MGEMTSEMTLTLVKFGKRAEDGCASRGCFVMKSLGQGHLREMGPKRLLGPAYGELPPALGSQ